METMAISGSNSESSVQAVETPPTESKAALTPQINNVDMETNEEAQVSELDQLMEKIKPAACGKKRTYSTIDISADKWFLTLDSKALLKLKEPPSLADGLDSETEMVRFKFLVILLIFCFRNCVYLVANSFKPVQFCWSFHRQPPLLGKYCFNAITIKSRSFVIICW